MADKDKAADTGAAKRGKPRPESGGGDIRPDRTRPKQGGPAGDAKGAQRSGGAGSAASDAAPWPQGQLAELKRYLKGVRSELDRVTWPTREKLGAATSAVLLILVTTTFFLWLVDTVIGLGFGYLFHQ